MNVIDPFVEMVLQFLPIEWVTQLWPLFIATPIKLLFLLVLAGLSLAQLYRRPRAMRWFLAAIGLALAWEGGLGFVVWMIALSLLSIGLEALGLSNQLQETIHINSWSVIYLLVEGCLAYFLWKSAFGESSVVPIEEPR